MGFTGEVLIYNKVAQTAASFESDPPYEISWAREGSIMFYGKNWGATDNALKIDVYWGLPARGFVPTQANLNWV